MTNDKVLEIRNLTKKYKDKVVFSEINLDFYRKKIYALVGNNGAGKSTLMKCICGIEKPNGGDIIFADKTTRVGTLIEAPGLITDMTAYQNIKAKCLCLGIKVTKQDINDLLALVGLEGVGKKLTRKFSMGMKQRLGIALALVGNPDVLILDEPTNSLDIQGIEAVREIIVKLHETTNMAIIVSSHNIVELKKFCTDYVVLHNGKIVKACTAEEFEAERGNLEVDEHYIRLVSAL